MPQPHFLPWRHGECYGLNALVQLKSFPRMHRLFAYDVTASERQVSQKYPSRQAAVKTLVLNENGTLRLARASNIPLPNGSSSTHPSDTYRANQQVKSKKTVKEAIDKTANREL